MKNNYWSKRINEETLVLLDKNKSDIDKELVKLYKTATNKCIRDISDTYEEIVKESKGEKLYLNTLYKYDRLNRLTYSLNMKLHELGEAEIKIYNQSFTKMYEDVKAKMKEVNAEMSDVKVGDAKSVVDTIWCSDGKHWSDRVWKHKDELRIKLIEGLSDTIIRGTSPEELKKELVRDFAVNYNQANAIVRTELNRIRTQEMKEMYVANGYEFYKISTAHDDDVCKSECEALEDKWFKFEEAEVGVNFPPLHVNCRCGIIAKDK